MSCSAPADCAEIERRRATGIGLLANGGASRGNLLSGEADEVILTVSRIDAEKRANPGYRAFLANGFNVTRALVLFFWEVVLEWMAAIRAIRRDVRPRGHRGGIYPFLRGAMCVVVRDLIVFGVLSDMMRGRPAVYATFSSYDEVAHHSGLQRADTMEALRKLDQQFGRIEAARRYAPRPYEIVVLSDHGQTQGATFKQRNGYGLDELVERSLSSRRGGRPRRRRRAVGDGRARAGRGDGAPGGQARQERRLGTRRGRPRLGQPRPRLPDGRAPPPDPRGDRRAPPGPDPGPAQPSPRRLAPGPLVRARPAGDRRAAARGGSPTDRSRARTRWRPSHRRPRAICCAPTASSTSPTSWSAASTTPSSTRGARSRSSSPSTAGSAARRPARSSCIPRALEVPDEPLLGAAAVHGLLSGWRAQLNGAN